MIHLRRIAPSDAPTLAEWWASSRIDSILVDTGRPDRPQVLLVAEEAGLLVGFADAFDIRMDAGSCEVGVGALPHAPPGTGMRIFAMVLSELFGVGFRRLQVRVRESNRKVLRMLKRSPFVLEGVLRQAVPKEGGGYEDVHLYSLLAQEFAEVRRRYPRLFTLFGGGNR